MIPSEKVEDPNPTVPFAKAMGTTEANDIIVQIIYIYIYNFCWI